MNHTVDGAVPIRYKQSLSNSKVATSFFLRSFLTCLITAFLFEENSNHAKDVKPAVHEAFALKCACGHSGSSCSILRESWTQILSSSAETPWPWNDKWKSWPSEV